jgi:hypothetical protein
VIVSGFRLPGLLATVLLVLACGGNPPPSVIVTGPDGMRTFITLKVWEGHPVACPAYAVADPVRGTFEGAVGNREPAWLVDGTGARLSIVWPEGFTVRFEPLAALANELGTVVVRAGQAVELGQVARDSASGTFEDPYIAQGIVLGGCYPYRPGDRSTG